MSTSTPVMPLRRVWPVVVPLLAVVLGIGWFLAQRPPVTSHRVLSAPIGDVVTVADQYVTLESVTATTAIVTEFGETLPTHGRWLLLRLAYQGIDAPAVPGEVAWVTSDGRTYRPDYATSPLLSEAQPGQWLLADVVVEVPLDAVTDGVVRVSPDLDLTGVPIAIAELQVAAEQITSAEEPVTVLESTWVENAHE